MTVMGVLNTLETICSVMEDQAEVCLGEINERCFVSLGDTVTLLAGERTCGSLFASSSPGWASSGLGQPTYSCV